MKHTVSATMSRAVLTVVCVVTASCGTTGTSPARPNDPARVADDAYERYEPQTTQSTAYFGNVRAVEPSPRSVPGERGWYTNRSFYHIWVNAFNDSDGDGIGDIPGMTARLDYIQELGATAIWLSPIFRTAGETPNPDANMHGYDVTNHYEINPYFGTKDDLAEFLDEAHARDIRVIFDYVPNHLSTEHPWFRAAADPSHPDHQQFRDYFVWSSTDYDSEYDGPWGQQVWHRNRAVDPGHPQAFYYGVFWSGMPDLNYEHPEVRRKMADVVTYWLNFGFDGMRVDAVKYLYEVDTDGDPATAPVMSDAPGNQEYFRAVRTELLEPYARAGHAKFMVVENWTGVEALDTYAVWDDPRAGERVALAQMSFDFNIGAVITSLVQSGASDAHREYLAERATYDMPADFRYGNFLSNHDNVRSRPMTMTGNVQDAALAAGYLLLSPGVPFVYYGNEIGMEGPAGNDIDLRRPFPWDAAEAQSMDDDSLSAWYRAMFTVRNAFAAVQDGAYTNVENSAGDRGVDTFVRHSPGEPAVLVVTNVGREPVTDVSIDLTSVDAATGGEYSPLVGPADGAGAALESRTFTLPELPVRAMRVFALGTAGAEHVLGDRSDVGTMPPPSPVAHPGQWNWEPSSQTNQMTEIDPADRHYAIERTLSAGGYLFKFHTNGIWFGFDELEFRPALSAPGVEVSGVDDGFDGLNIQASLPEGGTYAFVFDLDDREYWVRAAE